MRSVCEFVQTPLGALHRPCLRHENGVIAVELLRIDQRVGINDFEHIIAHRIIKLVNTSVQCIADQFRKAGVNRGKNGDYLGDVSFVTAFELAQQAPARIGAPARYRLISFGGEVFDTLLLCLFVCRFARTGLIAILRVSALRARDASK